MKMAETTVQAQLDEINRKLDLVMECAMSQRLRSDAMEDLMADLSIVGKDAYNSSVALLEKHNVEVDPEELRILAVRLLKNIKNINTAIDAFESVFDLVRDAAPLVKEMIIDFSKKMNGFEQKGYFDFIAALGKVIDKIITNTSAEDINLLGDKIVLGLKTVKSMQQPVPSYSVFRLMREINSPEMKKVFGFLLTFMKNYSKAN
jgi:predicted ATP-binding protein involved in virulence